MQTKQDVHNDTSTNKKTDKNQLPSPDTRGLDNEQPQNVEDHAAQVNRDVDKLEQGVGAGSSPAGDTGERKPDNKRAH